ncbi:hypothetical protein ACFQ0B_45980 [Nonomuraea thailandensis]
MPAVLSTPAAHSRALPAGPGPAGPAQERVASLLSQDGAYDPISVPAWVASDRAAVERLMNTMSSSTRDLLRAARKDSLLRAVGDPGHLLVHSEYGALGRTIRSWHAVERGDLPSYVRGPGEITGPAGSCASCRSTRPRRWASRDGWPYRSWSGCGASARASCCRRGWP